MQRDRFPALPELSLHSFQKTHRNFLFLLLLFPPSVVLGPHLTILRNRFWQGSRCYMWYYKHCTISLDPHISFLVVDNSLFSSLFMTTQSSPLGSLKKNILLQARERGTTDIQLHFFFLHSRYWLLNYFYDDMIWTQ